MGETPCLRLIAEEARRATSSHDEARPEPPYGVEREVDRLVDALRAAAKALQCDPLDNSLKLPSGTAPPCAHAADPSPGEIAELAGLLRQVQDYLSRTPSLAHAAARLPDWFGDGVRLMVLYRRLFAGAPESAARRTRDRRLISRREAEVLRASCTGLSHDAIGRSLGISARTVDTHFEHIYAKLGVRNRFAAVVRAVALGYLDLDTLPFMTAWAEDDRRLHPSFHAFLSSAGAAGEDTCPAWARSLAQFGLMLVVLCAAAAGDIQPASGTGPSE